MLHKIITPSKVNCLPYIQGRKKKQGVIYEKLKWCLNFFLLELCISLAIRCSSYHALVFVVTPNSHFKSVDHDHYTYIFVLCVFVLSGVLIPVARGGSVKPPVWVTGSKLFSHTSHLTYGMSTSGRSCLNRNGIFCYLAIYIPEYTSYSICGRPSLIPSFQINIELLDYKTSLSLWDW